MESEAMELAPPGSPQPLWLLNNLGVSISARYTRRGDPADLDRAIALAEEALALSPPGNADRPSRLSNLSIVLSTRYEHRGDAADLDRAIELSGQAIAETPVASPFLNIRQHNHGAHLAIRYDRQGAPADLDDAIELARAAIEGTPGDSPDQPSRRGNLALRYAARYAGRGRAEDLEASVREGEMALALTPVGAIERPIRLSNLASSLANSWRRASHLPVTHTLPSSPQSGGMTSTLTQAIALASEALDLLDPGDPERGAHLASLARFHQWHHDATSDLTDLVKAVAFAEASVHATPNGHPSRPSRLSLLASLLAADATNRETGLRATDLHRQAWDAITRTPGFAGFAVIAVGNGLADSLRRHFQTDSQDVVDELWRVLSVTLDALDGYLARLPLDADDDALYAVGTFGHLYAWLIEVAVRRVEDAAGRGASVEDLVRETFTAIERSKGRRLVSRLQAGALRPSASAQPFVDALERLKPELDRLETLLFGGREQPSQNLGSSGASVGANLPAMSLGWLSERSPLPQRSTSPIQPSQGGFPGVDDAKPGSVTANSAWAPPGSAGVSIGGQDAERSAADWGRMSDRLRALQTEFSELLRKIERSDPTYATARGYAPPQPLEAVAQALPPGAVLAMFAPMASRTAVVVVWVDGEGVTRFDLRTFGISEAQWVDLVHRTFGDGTRTEGSLQTLDRDLGAVLRAIGDRLIPVLAPLLSGATDAIPRHHLVIVPTGAMHRLPLHAVPWAPRGIARWDGVTRLIDRHPVTYATTADLLPLVTARSVSHSGVASLAPGIGLRPSDVEPHVTVALAVGLAREARLASSSSGGADDIALRLRADASREEILARSVVTGRRFGFVAAHGRAGRTGSSGLLLHRGDAFSDADLTAKDLHPTADQATSALGTGPGSWVTSSELLARLDLRGVDHLQMLACSTHADDPSPGDHLTSLLTALLICGARSVGGTLWAVDEVGAVLVGWKAGTALIRGETDKADALRRATRWLRTATSGEIGTVIAELGGALSEHLPAGDRAHTAIAVLAERFATVHAGHDEPPYADVVHWAPYVLHGAPIVGPHA
jgi:tetratricopeptide (TPR) repeat protein